MALNIFISYATKDLARIQSVLDIFKSQEQMRLFMAERSMLPGEKFEERILEEIKQADLFILFYSKHAHKSHYVQNEVGVAKGKGIPVIPILLDRTKPEGMIESHNYVDLSNTKKYPEEKERLEKFIINKLQKENFKNLVIIGGLFLLFMKYLEK